MNKSFQVSSSMKWILFIISLLTICALFCIYISATPDSPTSTIKPRSVPNIPRQAPLPSTSPTAVQ